MSALRAPGQGDGRQPLLYIYYRLARVTGVGFPNGIGDNGGRAVMPLESGPVTTPINALLVVALAVALAYGNGAFG